MPNYQHRIFLHHGIKPKAKNHQWQATPQIWDMPDTQYSDFPVLAGVEQNTESRKGVKYLPKTNGYIYPTEFFRYKTHPFILIEIPLAE